MMYLNQPLQVNNAESQQSYTWHLYRLRWYSVAVVCTLVYCLIDVIYSGFSSADIFDGLSEYAVYYQPYSGSHYLDHERAIISEDYSIDTAVVIPVQIPSGLQPREDKFIDNSTNKYPKGTSSITKELDRLRKNEGDINWFTENRTRLVYIKLHKVGGTSIAAALGRVSRKYGYRFPKNILNNETCLEKHGLYNMSFIHSPVASWMKRCLPEAQYVTIIREPVSGYVSHLTWWWNREYFVTYPDRGCNYTKVPPDEKPEEKPFICYDDAYRKQVALDKLIKVLSSKKKHLSLRDRNSDCSHMCNWFSESLPMTPDEGIKSLQQDFSLVGVTEHLDEFLLLLALQKGWSMNSVLYHRCKDQGEVKVSADDLKKIRPDLYARIKWALRHETKVYQWAKQQFELLLSRLGPSFFALLKEYKTRLKIFNEKYLKNKTTNTRRWVKTPHGVGYC